MIDNILTKKQLANIRQLEKNALTSHNRKYIISLIGLLRHYRQSVDELFHGVCNGSNIEDIHAQYFKQNLIDYINDMFCKNTDTDGE